MSEGCSGTKKEGFACKKKKSDKQMCLQGSKKAKLAVLPRERVGCGRRDRQAQLRQGLEVMLRTLTFILSSMDRRE